MAEKWAVGVMTGMHQAPAEALGVVHDMGIKTVQLSYPAHLNNAEGIGQIKSAASSLGVEITTVFCGFPGERYDDIPTVRATVGLVPEDTRADRVAKIAEIQEFAQQLGVDRVAAHIGFIPEEASDPRYGTLVETMRKICEDGKARGQVFALETGQETAGTLERFINDVGVDNLRVNFDPANMILYGNDKPIPALDLLGKWVDGVHCKDGTWPTEADKLGHETPLGEGEVNIPAWIAKLVEIGFTGPLTIEREISGEEQRKDIVKGKELIEGLLQQHR
jgi:sugar phosphate isomerase/epimerase